MKRVLHGEVVDLELFQAPARWGEEAAQRAIILIQDRQRLLSRNCGRWRSPLHLARITNCRRSMHPQRVVEAATCGRCF